MDLIKLGKKGQLSLPVAVLFVPTSVAEMKSVIFVLGPGRLRRRQIQ